MSSLLREAEAELKETNERIYYTGQYYAFRQGMDRGHVPHSRIIGIKKQGRRRIRFDTRSPLK